MSSWRQCFCENAFVVQCTMKQFPHWGSKTSWKISQWTSPYWLHHSSTTIQQLFSWTLRELSLLVCSWTVVRCSGCCHKVSLISYGHSGLRELTNVPHPRSCGLGKVCLHILPETSGSCSLRITFLFNSTVWQFKPVQTGSVKTLWWTKNWTQTAVQGGSVWWFGTDPGQH